MLKDCFYDHNQEVKEVWDSFHAGRPIRMPMALSYNARIILLNPRYNRGIDFQKYYSDPMVMLKVQLQMQDYAKTHLWFDHEMGIPEEGYDVMVDFQNDVECCHLGANVQFSPPPPPFVVPFLAHGDKRRLLNQGPVEPFNDFTEKLFSYYDAFCEQRDKGFLYNGKPLKNIGMAGMGTDGPFTLACMLRGTENFCVDLFEDPDYAREMLEFLTDNAIRRIKAFRKRLGMPEKLPSFAFADDSILLLSEDTYKEYILPYHKKLVAELSTGEQPNWVHFCGDASRHFVTIQKEVHFGSIDTGFPIQHGKLVQQLAPGTAVWGGVHVDLLSKGTPEQVERETLRIMRDVMPHTNFFVMKEANNLAPQTPEENIRAMYETVRAYGKYQY